MRLTDSFERSWHSTMTVEFNVPGRPVSAQSGNIASLRQWQLEVSRAAISALAQPMFSPLLGRLPLDEPVHVEAIYFYPGQRAMIDVDNMVKPMLDALKRLVYTDGMERLARRTVMLKVRPAR